MHTVYFANVAEFRAWLAQHHATATELIVGFFKKGAKKSGITYAEAVDEALCFGWIDGIVRRVDEERYTHRFTPRRSRSIWSNANVGHVNRLIAAGRMKPAGLAAFSARTESRTGVYTFEKKVPATLPAPFRRLFQTKPDAWKFFQGQPPGYHRHAIGWIMGAKQAATRERRMVKLMLASAAGRRVV